MRNKGHKVLTPDLPGLGDDNTAIEAITLSKYVDSIITVAKAQYEKIILVGHSMAGVVISSVAEQIPDKIDKLIFLCAIMPTNGQSLIDIRNQYLAIDKASIQLEFSNDFLSCTPASESIEEVFYHYSSDEDIAYAKSLLKPQATIVLHTPVVLTKQNYGKIPRIYIECTDDNAIPIGLQREMLSKQPVARVYSLDTDHSPFFSTPELLNDILNEVTIDNF